MNNIPSSLTILSLAQNFFSPQAEAGIKLKPAAYLVKHVLHDWSDSYCRTILKHLRNAVNESKFQAKLFVIDYIVPFACSLSKARDKSDEEIARNSIPGVYQDLASSPLLEYWGAAADFPYYMDLNVSRFPCV